MTTSSSLPPRRPARPNPTAREIERVRDRYVRAVIKGDETEAAEAIQEAVSYEWRPATIYLEVLAKAMIKIGDMWHSGELNVAHEHQATQVTLRQASYLRQFFLPERQTGLHAVVSAVERDGHVFGAMIFANLLAFDGWNVDFLGAGTPPEDLGKIVEERQPDLVALSATMSGSLELLSECVEAVRSANPESYVVIGGSAVLNSEEPPGADMIASDPMEAVVKIGEHFNVNGASEPREVVLQRIGEQVKTKRVARGWSQQQLADAAGLDRTYLSGVEHGKQNLTVGAMKKLGDALNTPIADFIG